MIDKASSEPVTLNGSCHCGAVQFTTTLTQGFASVRRCTCSICRMRGAVAVTSTPDAFRITQGEDKLATYRFNTTSAEHHFCSVCGIYTHHKRRSNPHQLGVNVACLEGVSPFDFREVIVFEAAAIPRTMPSTGPTSPGYSASSPLPAEPNPSAGGVRASALPPAPLLP